MEKRTLGTSTVQITPILMGTWQAGKRMWVGIEDADSIKTIRAALKLVLLQLILLKSMVKDTLSGL